MVSVQEDLSVEYECLEKCEATWCLSFACVACSCYLIR